MTREEQLKQAIEENLGNDFPPTFLQLCVTQALSTPSILRHADPEIMKQAGWVREEEWISAEGDLPDSHRDVYLHIDGVGVCTGFFNPLSKTFSHFYGDAKVTHWTEITKPQPPKI